MGFLLPKVSAPAPAPLPPVQPLPEPPAPVAKELPEETKEEINKEQAAMERKRKGRKSTILTGPLGLQEEATVEKKTLLGA